LCSPIFSLFHDWRSCCAFNDWRSLEQALL